MGMPNVYDDFDDVGDYEDDFDADFDDEEDN